MPTASPQDIEKEQRKPTPYSRTLKKPRTRQTIKSSDKGPQKPTPKDPPRNLLHGTKLQAYLDHIAATSQEVSLADIERHKLTKHAPPHSPEYEAQYRALVATLLRSFSANQLRQFLDMYHLVHRPKCSKWEMAVKIIEHQWNWPSLMVIQREKRDWSEVIVQSFPLDARQAFLILGKDGANLLALSSGFDAHVSFSANPLSLNVEGLRGSIDNLRRHIDDFRIGIKEQIFQLPPGNAIGQDSLQRISRISGAFTEYVGQELIRISYISGGDHAAHFSKQLALRAAAEVVRDIPTVYSLAVLEPPMRHIVSVSPTYSLYPFLSTRLNLGGAKMGSLFRIRRVGDWLKSGMGEGPPISDGLNSGQTMTLSGKLVKLRDALASQIISLSPEVCVSRAHVTASFGHLLCSSAAPQRLRIMPSFMGTTPDLRQVMDWFQNQAFKKIFVPSLPTAVVNSPPTQQRLIHRLLYHSFLITGNDGQPVTRTLKFELVLDLLNPSSTDDHGTEAKHLSGHLGGASEEIYVNNDILEPTCWEESFNYLDLMMPDRPLDIRLSMVTNTALPEVLWPNDIQSYSGELRSFLTTSGQSFQPEIPLTFTHHGVMYRLESSSTVRQSHGLPENLNISRDSSSQIVTESVLDLDSDYRTRICTVTCSDIESDTSWNSFLDHLDTLTIPVYSKPLLGRNV